MKEQWAVDVVSALYKHGISQNELAEEVGVSHQYLSMVLNGKRQSVSMPDRILDAIDQILERRGADKD